MWKDLNDDFVQSIAKLATDNKVQQLTDDGGRGYFSKSVTPMAPAIAVEQKLSTLDGLIDMIKAEKLSCSIYIAGPNNVYLRSTLDDKWRNRETFAVSTIDGCSFPFEREMSIEDFIIRLQCNFVDTDNKKKIIDLVSSITVGGVTTADDDGIAQEVVTKASIGHKKSKVKLDPIVGLKPYRTFPEVEQPTDKFLLRIHHAEGCLPRVSLRSAGGHMWKLAAVNSIYEYLKEKAPEGIAVIR
ncbi:MAG: hypothetical protein GY841_15625 [FCB group bacterium]|nr:hypothetical protein [FCB group bacterium]